MSVDSILSTVSRDNLIAGTNVLTVTEEGTLITGQNLTRGAVLGKISLAAGTAVAGTNTGNGTVSAFALAAGGPALIGSYVATCTAAATDSGTFSIKDPNGVLLGYATVGSAFTAAGITVTIADGTTDFIVGDSFTLPITAGSGKLTQLSKAYLDGSQKVWGVLAANTDATTADKSCIVYKTGQFNRATLSFVSGTTYADIEEDARDKNIHLVVVKDNAAV